MAFSWQQKKEKTPIEKGSFSWNSGKPKEQIVVGRPYPGAMVGTVLTLPSNEQNAARSKIDAYNQNSPIGIVKGTIKEIPKPFIKAYEGIKAGWNSVEKSDKNVGNLYSNLQKSSEEGGKIWANSVDDLSKRFSDTIDAFKNKEKSGVEREVSAGRSALGLANLFFAPVSGVMKMISPIPVVGHLAEKTEQLFSAIGNGAGAFAGDILDKFPGISEDKKKDLKPLVEETAAFVAMIAAGKGGEIAYGKVKNNTQTLFNELRSVDVNSVSGSIDRSPIGSNPPRKLDVLPEPTKVPVSRVGTPKPERVPVRQGYDEAYVPENQLPVIQFGSKAKETIPTIQIGENTQQSLPKPSKSEYTYEPIVEKTEYQPTQKQTQNLSESATKKKGEAIANRSDTFQSETSLKLKEEAKKLGHSEEDLSDIPVQERRTKVEDWKTADELVSTDMERALKVVRGKLKPPSGLMIEDVYKALEISALRNGDVDLINTLLPMKIGTEAGRGLQALDRGMDGTYSTPIEVARSVEAERASVVNQVKKNIEKKKAGELKLEKNTWQDFLKEIPIC